MGYTTVTTRKTVNWFVRKQLHSNYVVPEGTKEAAINLSIELEKHKLYQIYGRNISIRTSLQKRVALKLKKPDVGKYDVRDKKQHTLHLQIVLIRDNRAQHHNFECK